MGQTGVAAIRQKMPWLLPAFALYPCLDCRGHLWQVSTAVGNSDGDWSTDYTDGEEAFIRIISDSSTSFTACPTPMSSQGTIPWVRILFLRNGRYRLRRGGKWRTVGVDQRHVFPGPVLTKKSLKIFFF